MIMENHQHHNHEEMDHSKMDHSKMKHKKEDHSKMNHGSGGHAGHNPAHGQMGHDHHKMMIADFRKRFWVTLVLTIPILFLRFQPWSISMVAGLFLKVSFQK